MSHSLPAKAIAERPSGSAGRKPLPLYGADPRNLALSFILFLITVGYLLPEYSAAGSCLVIVFAALLIIYTIAYGLGLHKPGRKTRAATAASFYTSILLFIVATALYISLGQASIVNFFQLQYVVSYLVMFLLLFFILQLYFYTKDRRIKLSVIAIVVILVAIYFTPHFINYQTDDEVVIGYYAVKNLFNGVNPYTVSISNVLYNLHSSIGTSLTITTNGSIIGVLDYPALYFLVQVPFYLLLNPLPQDLTGSFIHAEGFVFVLLFLLAYMLIAADRTSTGSKYLVYIALGLFTLYLSSMITFLMLALVLILYSGIGKRHSWLFLGLALSLQEQLWIIVLLFIAYTFNTYGAKRGLRELAGALAVFMIINSYFIISSPSGYLNNFLEITSAIQPSGLSPIGYIIATSFNVPLHAFTYIFLGSILLALVISLYVNDRKLILLFSVIPFLFLGHALQIYYLLPIVAFVLVADVKVKESAGNWLRTMIAGSQAARCAYASLLLVSLLLILAVSVYAHNSYSSGFGMSADNISITRSNSTTLTYHAYLSYNYRNATPMYLLIEIDANSTGKYFGVFNYSIIKGSQICGFPCSVNPNRIILPSTGSYSLTATIPANIHTPAYISAVLSNNEYYFRTQPLLYR